MMVSGISSFPPLFFCPFARLVETVVRLRLSAIRGSNTFLPAFGFLKTTVDAPRMLPPFRAFRIAWRCATVGRWILAFLLLLARCWSGGDDRAIRFFLSLPLLRLVQDLRRSRIFLCWRNKARVENTRHPRRGSEVDLSRAEVWCGVPLSSGSFAGLSYFSGGDKEAGVASVRQNTHTAPVSAARSPATRQELERR